MNIGLGFGGYGIDLSTLSVCIICAAIVACRFISAKGRFS